MKLGWSTKRARTFRGVDWLLGWARIPAPATHLSRMPNPFFERPIYNSPYEYPQHHWEFDPHGQPTGILMDRRRRAEFVTPIPKPKRRKGKEKQEDLVLDECLEIDADTWATLNSDIPRPFPRPKSGRIAVKVINHFGDEVVKVFRVEQS